MSLFTRLFLLIALVSGVSLSVVAGLLWRNSVELERQLRLENNQAGARVLHKGTRLLEESLSDTHLMIVREKARKVESYFVNIADAVQLEATLAQQFLSDEGSLASTPPLFAGNDLTRRARTVPSLSKTLVAVQPYSIFHLAPEVSRRETQQSLNRLRRLGAFFAHTQRNVPGCDSTYFGSEMGFILGYPGGKTFFKPTFDPRRRPWYRQAMKAPIPGALIWIVNLDRDGKTLLLTCARTVTMPGKSQPVGVAAIDVKLPNVVDEMFDVENLGVSKAILMDDAQRVRVSSSYDQSSGESTPSFDNREGVAMPPVTSLPEFAAVAAYIRTDTSKSAGIYWNGKENGKSMAGTESVYIYSRVRFSHGEAVSGEANSKISDEWHYIVQLPMSSLLEPITSVTREMRGSTHGISQAIQVRTRKSASLVLGLIGATLLVALGVSYFAARSTARPLIQMAAVARGVGQGNLDQQAIETSGGEIGEMGRAINAMISGLRQRNLLKETFSRYTAPSVVEEVLRRGGVQLGGVKSEATIFFSDLAGFTTLAEKTSPEALVELLNEYFDAMTQVILGSEGTLDKYIGDAILAFWGHPLTHDDDAARSCRAALEQFDQLRRLCDKWTAEGRPPLDMRIGIETGEVIVGDIGSTLKLNYTVLGDTVNFASRLEGVNKIYGTHILIGENTRRLAGEAIEVREIDLLAVAGKRRPVGVYELLGMKGDVSPEQLAGYAHYERGLSAYRNRQWDEAETQLNLALGTLGNDKPSEVLLTRIKEFRFSPPPANWDGSFILDHK
jgi:class 3 adenylate cyclase